MNVTWSDLIQFCMLIVAILAYAESKKKQPLHFPQLRLLLYLNWGNRLLAAPHHTYPIPQFQCVVNVPALFPGRFFNI